MVAFLVNLGWENAQAPLYDEGFPSPRQVLTCGVASVFDALYTAGLYLVIAALWRNRRWLNAFGVSHVGFILLAGFDDLDVAEEGIRPQQSSSR